MYTAFMSSIIMSVALLIAMAFFTLAERKFLAYSQLRKGPNKPSLMGLPQPIADAVKLFTKEQIKPMMSNRIPFYIAPALALVLALNLGNLMPSPSPVLSTTFSAPLFAAISSLNVYATLTAGWASNSKYALLGTVRAMAQTISYEVGMSLCMLMALVVMGSLSLTNSFLTQTWPCLLLPLLIPIWLATILAETNRTPYDLVEGESELVSGFNIEYSAGPFAMIFMAEYTSILAMSMFTATLFSSSMIGLTLVLKTVALAAFFLWARTTLPRMRYDSLMHLMWLMFLPATLAMAMMYLSLFIMLGGSL